MMQRTSVDGVSCELRRSRHWHGLHLRGLAIHEWRRISPTKVRRFLALWSTMILEG